MNDPQFDDVIVGGGSAGCVLANRLSANGDRRVLLIEAGQDTLPGAEPAEILDSYPMPVFFGDRYIWPGLSVSTGRAQDGQTLSRAYEQGRVIGGGSSINVQSANRGLPRDYDEWRDLGARGWAWDDVLPYFRKLETDLDFEGPLHGSDGPITRSARVVSCRVRTIEKRTLVHSSLVGHTWPGWVGSVDSREHTIEPSELWEMHSIGAIDPSRASTTSAIVISPGGRASR